MNQSGSSPGAEGCPGFLQTRLHRREAVRIGFCSALGLCTGELLRLQSLAQTGADLGSPLLKERKARSVIHLHLPGGVAQQESWDPKPEAPSEYRGAFGVSKTVTGEIFSENFTRLARVSDKINVVRSVVGKIPDHGQATYHLFTGYTPTTVIDYPQMGAVVSHLLGQRGELPPYVAVPSLGGFSGGTGYLSSSSGAFQINADPGDRGEFRVRDMTLSPGVTPAHLEQRNQARAIVESKLRQLDADADKLDTMDGFYKTAFSLLTSENARRAFDLSAESDATRDLYGRGYTLKQNTPAAVGERLLLARRLIEADVRFVTVQYGGWDSHVDIKGTCKDLMPALDHALTGLITDLDQRGLLDSTLVMVTSEFGRTPKVNSSNGRDHWARVYSMLLAGGGLTRGQILGASDATAAEPARDAASLEDFLSTVYHQLGIDSSVRLPAFGGTRPIDIVKGGKPLKALIA